MSVIVKGSTGVLADVNSQHALLVTPGNGVAPTFVASVSGQANVASSDAVAVESGPTLVTRLRRVVVFNPGSQTAAGLRVLQLVRTTSAGAAGVVAPAPADVADAFTGVVRARPTSQGAAGAVVFSIPVFVPAAAAAFVPLVLDMDALGFAKAVRLPAGVANGIALRDPGAAGAAGFSAAFIFTEEAS